MAADECRLLDTSVADVNARYPDGVGLVVGKVPSAAQSEALQALISAMDTVKPKTPELISVRKAITVASQTLLDRATASQPLTQEDQDAFAAAMSAASTFCGPLQAGSTGSPTPTRSSVFVSPPATTSPAGAP